MYVSYRPGFDTCLADGSLVSFQLKSAHRFPHEPTDWFQFAPILSDRRVTTYVSRSETDLLASQRNDLSESRDVVALGITYPIGCLKRHWRITLHGHPWQLKPASRLVVNRKLHQQNAPPPS